MFTDVVSVSWRLTLQGMALLLRDVMMAIGVKSVAAGGA